MARTYRRPAAAAVVGVAWLAFYACWLAAHPGGARGLTWFSDTAYLVPILGATVLAAFAAKRAHDGLRAFWAVVAASNALWLAAEVLWSVRELSGHEIPFPWWTDAGYLASYALIPAALWIAFRPSFRTVALPQLLDAAIVVGSLAMLWWWLVLEPLAIGLDAATLVALAYPVFGLVMLGTLVATRLLPSRGGSLALRLFGAGVAASALADGIYTSAAVTHSYVSGNWIGVGWQAEAVLFCIAAAVPVFGLEGRADWARPRYPSEAGAGGVATGALALLVVVLLAAGLGHDFSPGLVAWTAVLAVLLTLRVWLLTRSAGTRSLTDLDGAYDRLYFDDQLRRLLSRARYFGDTFSVALVDVEGQQSPSHDVVRRLVGAARDVDCVAVLWPGRLGVLLPRTRLADAIATAERMRAAVAKSPITGEEQDSPSAVTVRVGVAAANAGNDPVDLLEHAEEALETARILGGNQVRGWNEDTIRRRPTSIDRLLSVARLVDEREGPDGEHSIRIASLAQTLAVALDLGTESSRRTYLGGLLHDLGMVELPDWLLATPALGAREWEAIRRHPETGAALLEKLGPARDAASVVVAHHERWDGAGYPYRLGGERIPAEARIVAVADGLVSMTTDRPYRPAFSMTAALTEIWRDAGKRYDPRVVGALFKLVREGELEDVGAHTMASLA